MKTAHPKAGRAHRRAREARRATGHRERHRGVRPAARRGDDVGQPVGSRSRAREVVDREEVRARVDDLREVGRPERRARIVHALDGRVGAHGAVIRDHGVEPGRGERREEHEAPHRHRHRVHDVHAAAAPRHVRRRADERVHPRAARTAEHDRRGAVIAGHDTRVRRGRVAVVVDAVVADLRGAARPVVAREHARRADDDAVETEVQVGAVTCRAAARIAVVDPARAVVVFCYSLGLNKQMPDQ